MKHVSTKERVYLNTATVAQMDESVIITRKLLKLFEPKGRCRWGFPQVGMSVIESEMALLISDAVVKTFREFEEIELLEQSFIDDQRSDGHIPFPTENALINCLARATFIDELKLARKTAVDVVKNNKEASVSKFIEMGCFGTIVEDVLFEKISNDWIAELSRKYNTNIVKDLEIGSLIMITSGPNDAIRIILKSLDFLTFGIPRDLRNIRDNRASSIGGSFKLADEALLTIPAGLRPVCFATDGYNTDILYTNVKSNKEIWRSQMTNPPVPVIGTGTVRIFRTVKVEKKYAYKEYEIGSTAYNAVKASVPIITRELENAIIEETIKEEPCEVVNRMAAKLSQLKDKFNHSSVVH